MSDTVGLKLVLEAQIKEFEKALDELEKREAKLSGSSIQLAKSTDGITDSIDKISPAAGKATTGVASLDKAVEAGQAVIEDFASSASGIGEAGAIAGEGAAAAGNAAAGVAESMEEATESSNDFVGSLAGKVGVAAAAAIAAGLLAKFAFSGLELSDVLHEDTVAFSDTEKAQMAFNEEMAKSQATAEAEVNTLESLIDIITDTARTKQEQADAIKVVNERYPEYLKHLQSEKIGTDQATTAIGKQIQLILTRSKVQGAQKAYEKALGAQAEAAYQVELKKLESQKEANDLSKGQSNFLKEQIKLIRDVANSVKEYGATNKSFSIVEKAQKDLSEANTLVDVFKKNLDVIFSDASKKGLLDDILGSGDGAGKTIKTVSDVLKELDTELKTIQERSDLVGTSVDELANQRLDALNKAFNDISKIGGPAARKELEKLAAQINLTSAAILGTQKIDTKQIFTFSKQKIKDKDVVGGKSKDVVAIDLPVKVSFSELEPGIKAAQDKLVGGIHSITDAGTIAWQQSLDNMNQVIQATALNGIASIAEGLGGALVGSGDFLGPFLNVLAGGLEQMGKMMIGYSGILNALDQALKHLDWRTAAVAGFAAIAAAGALKAYAKKGVPSYATGGITDGPTLAMVGDNPSGREAMIPEELWPFLGGGGAPIYVENNIDANGLTTIVKRGMKEEARVR